jgi:hypothetical protein
MIRSLQYSNTPTLRHYVPSFSTISLASRREIRTIVGLHGNDSIVGAS